MIQYCIVGGGPAGLVLANALCQSVSADEIVILEAGGNLEENIEAAKFVSRGKTEYKPIRSFRLGGHGHLWGGACPRLHPDDFRMRSQFSIYVDWPFEYSDLEPYYDLAEKLLSVDSSDTQVVKESLDPIEKGLLESGYNGILPYGNQRYFVDHLLPELQRSGIEIRTNCVVRFIDEIDGIASVSYYDTEARTTQQLHAQHVVLCCGGLSNARILQLSTSPRFPNGIGNHAGFLGRYHMDHPRIQVSIKRNYSAQGGDLERDGALPLTLTKVVDAGLPSIAFASITINRKNEVSLAKPDLERVLQDIRKADDLQAELMNLLSVADSVSFDFETMDPPGKMNTLDLADELDVFGDPMLATNINIDAERSRVDSGVLQILGEIFGKYGYRVVSLRKSGWTGQHPSGSTRMAKKREEGVVDANLRVFDTKSIYVVGSSVFPTVGYANPTLTIISLVLRLADHFLALRENSTQ